ncbi:MAG: M23 family metallopeptidase [Gammaproteobacteria bacterium]
MPFRIRSGVPGLAPSRARWLQLAACAVLAWAALRGEPPVVGTAQTTQTTQTAPTAQTPDTATAEPELLSPPIEPQTAGLGFSTIEVIVRRNDTLDQIFRRLQLNLADLASLRGLPGLKAQLDRLRPGEALTLTHREGELIGFERRLSPSETLKVMRESSGFLADVLENPLETDVRTVYGVIDSSLFEAVTAAGAHDQTALELAEIFAWDIDFVLDIQRGDSFVVTYEEISQDGEYVKDGAVLAASFVNQGREFRGVRYVDPQGRAHYFSPDGRSLRKAFLRAPVQFSRVSSRFNPSRRHPILNRIRAHKGVDYAAPTGTAVRAAGDGRIQFVGRKGGYGNVIEIAHAGGVVTVYGHLSRFARGTRSGARVSQGDLIGLVGSTGLASGPHLHYEYQLRGVHKNPQTVKLPDATPIDPALLSDFLAQSSPLLASLEFVHGPVLVSR